jgi:hypothetical protein
MAKLLQKLEGGDVEEVKKFLREKVAEGKAKRIASGKGFMLKLATAKDLPERIIEAIPVGEHFAVHRAWGETRGPWNVTHRHSGLAAATCIGKKATAILWANELASLPVPWDREEPLRGLDKETMDRCVAISRSARNGDKP